MNGDTGVGRGVSTSAPDRAPLSTRRVLVTGGEGFLGRHLVRRLSEQGAHTLVIDDGRLEREHEEIGGTSTVLRRDFRDVEALHAVRDFEPSIVFHLAAMHFVPDCDRDPSACLDLNVLGFERLLASLRETPVESVVFTSSAVVYGFSDAPRREDDELSPRHIYAHSKWLGEGLLRHFQQDRPDVRTVATRLFNLIGPGDTAPHVLPQIVDAVAAGGELSLGNIWPRRDYVHVTDVARALCDVALGPAQSMSVNVGTGVGRSVSDILDTLTRITGRRPTVRRDPARERSTDGHLVADVTQIMAQTPWRPTWGFEDCLRQLLDQAAHR